MKSFGIQFAPLNVPFRRRIQTLSACFWIVSIAFGNLICLWLMIYWIFCTKFYPLAFLYLIWAYFDRETPVKGGRKMSIVRNFILWKYFREYFPINLVKTGEFTPEKNYLFCAFPHGLLSAATFGNFANNYSNFSQIFPGLDAKCSTLDIHFKVPLFRDYLLGLGTVSTSRESLEYIFREGEQGKVVVLIVGGAAESMYSRPGAAHRIILSRRKGFIKLALRTGTSLVPVFNFGEINIYDQVSNPPGSLLHRVQLWLKEMSGLAPCIPIGRGFLQYSFGIIPRRYPITTVVGEPINVPKISHPTEEEIEKYHSLFTEQLQLLFNREKHKYIKDAEKAELLIE